MLQLDLNKNKSVRFGRIYGTNFLILDQKLFEVSKDISLFTKNNTLFFVNKKNTPEQQLALLKRSIQNYDKNTIFTSILRLKGLGYKTINLPDVEKIELKLGHSHKNLISKNVSLIKTKSKKNIIVLEGNDKMVVGNYAQKLCLLKKTNIYTGKGIYKKKNKLLLKEFKK